MFFESCSSSLLTDNSVFYLRHWNYREHAWYYHDLPTNSTYGYTGSGVVAMLIIMLWFYSCHKLWLVWINKLNFDGVRNINDKAE